ncbi:MAG: hypothetical protein AB1646_21425 [Thermodesulfobacteriota bacterium]
MAHTPKKPLMPGRVALIGEEGIPRHVVERIDDEHMQIFLREPDPRNWPAELQPLVVFLSVGERLAAVVAAVMDGYEQALEEAMQPVLRDVCASLAELSAESPLDLERIADEIVRPIRRFIRNGLDKTIGAP